MARKRYKKVSFIRQFLAFLVLMVLFVVVFIVGARNPKTAKQVENFSKDTAHELLDKGRAVLDESTEQKRE